MNNIVRISNTKFDQKTVSLLCVKTKSGAHKQLTFYFQMWKYFCRHLHSSLISMVWTYSSFNQSSKSGERWQEEKYSKNIQHFFSSAIFCQSGAPGSAKGRGEARLSHAVKYVGSEIHGNLLD